MDEPERPNARKNNEEPKWIKLRMEVADPTRAKDRSDRGDPMVQNESTDR